MQGYFLRGFMADKCCSEFDNVPWLQDSSWDAVGFADYWLNNNVSCGCEHCVSITNLSRALADAVPGYIDLPGRVHH